MTQSSYSALRDQNRIPIAQGQSNTDSTQTLPFKIDSVTGRLLVDAAGSTTASLALYSETPGGAIDGINKVYTTAHTIVTVIGMWYNGEFIHPSEYTVSGAGFTLGTALPVISGAAFTITYSAGLAISGTTLTILAATGTIDNTNVTFTFTIVPGVIVVNGASYQVNKGWTWNNGTLTATLASPVGVGGDIFGIE